ncbi:hypothetical protein V8E55_008496 [Tylopilus felleus]
MTCKCVGQSLPLIHIDIVAHASKESADALGMACVSQYCDVFEGLLPHEFWEQSFLDRVEQGRMGVRISAGASGSFPLREEMVVVDGGVETAGATCTLPNKGQSCRGGREGPAMDWPSSICAPNDVSSCMDLTWEVLLFLCCMRDRKGWAIHLLGEQEQEWEWERWHLWHRSDRESEDTSQEHDLSHDSDLPQDREHGDGDGEHDVWLWYKEKREEWWTPHN